MQRFFDINLFFFKEKPLRDLKSNYNEFMTIVLIGYMGSGKSTVGRHLSKIIEFDYVDLDDYIEEKEGMTITELFSIKGEIYFRKIESLYLKEIISLDGTVISLGGGTPCYGHNMQMILNADNLKSIYLKLTLPKLVERLGNEKNSRPLISHLESEAQLTEFIGKHLFERSYFYNKANIILSIDGKSIEEISEDIVLKLF